jgi:competence protein ComEC
MAARVYHVPAQPCRLRFMVALAARMVARAGLRLPAAALPAALRGLLAAESRHAALWLPAAFGAGIAAYFALRHEPPAELGALLALGAVLLLAVLWRSAAARWPISLALTAALGLATIQLHAALAPPVPPLPSRAVMIEAQVVGTETLPQGTRLTLSAATWEGQAAPHPRTLRLRLRGSDPAEVRPGDRIRVRALLRPPSAPAEPGAFDFQRAAFFNGQGGAGFALAPVEVLARGSQAQAGPLVWFARLRSAVVARTYDAVPGPPGAIAAALLTGQQTGITAADAQAMRDSGLSHVLSPSGLHVGIVLGTLFFAVRLLLALSEWAALALPIKQIALVVGLAGGGFYTGLTGAEVPMLRTFLMAALVVLAVLLGRHALSLRGLALAALVVLGLRPDALVSASFQMSFAAVAALIAGFASVQRVLPGWLAEAGWWRRPALLLGGLVASSLLASIATAPFALFHFQRASLYGVFANMLAVPLTSVLIMPAGIVAMLLMPFGLEWLALVPMGIGCRAMLAIAYAVADLPGAAASLPAMPGWGLLLCTAGLLVLCLCATRLRLAGAPLLLAGMLSPVWHVPPDVLVSADAGLIAVRDGAGLKVFRAHGAQNFTQETWARRAGGAVAQPLACAPPFCTVGPVAVVPQGPAPPGVCGRFAVVVSPQPLRNRCRGSLAIDRFDAWRDGPHAVWFTPAGPVAVSDRAARGDRPWVPPRPVPFGAGPVAVRE